MKHFSSSHDTTFRHHLDDWGSSDTANSDVDSALLPVSNDRDPEQYPGINPDFLSNICL